MTTILRTGLMAPALLCAAMTHSAFAQDAASDAAAAFEAAIGDAQPVKNYPSPWPLRNLLKEGVLTVGTTGTSPPRTFVDPATSELSGSYVELFEKLAEDLGLDIEFVQLEWAGILPGLAAKRFDIACDGASWNPERLGSDQFLMTSPTGLNATVGIALKDGGLSSFDEIGDEVIGGVRGEIYFEGAKKALPDAEATDFPGLQESLLGLQNGQANVVVMNLSNALSVLENAPNKDDLMMVGPALEVFPQSLCVNATEPDLLVAVNTLLGNYRADGSLSDLIGKYATSTAEVDLLGKIGY
ncbi:substrate-binding periplasmic protein [Alloyangia pacifica]|uniref:Cystine transport system substrate-binding protein n=1 Tax=Alloyangia pacifica TaxID=311180 RepID=A0A1I6UYP1_9RHOB|nr:transporter substrate-binding domain-containing protein [Alloyangia pacifica]SDI31072.1 cystine transport system substrate-binding protein [Alloyangia pacifica]SFT06570.1 cystine transport system substrate-binding protein [Alloyangia pacifica]